MRLIDLGSKEVYYDTEGIEYYITQKFWKALKAGKIQYRTGGERDDILFTEILVLDIDDDAFEKIFENIALSTAGKAMMVGKLSVTIIL